MLLVASDFICQKNILGDLSEHVSRNVCKCLGWWRRETSVFDHHVSQNFWYCIPNDSRGFNLYCPNCWRVKTIGFFGIRAIEIGPLCGVKEVGI